MHRSPKKSLNWRVLGQYRKKPSYILHHEAFLRGTPESLSKQHPPSSQSLFAKHLPKSYPLYLDTKSRRSPILDLSNNLGNAGFFSQSQSSVPNSFHPAKSILLRYLVALRDSHSSALCRHSGQWNYTFSTCRFNYFPQRISWLILPERNRPGTFILLALTGHRRALPRAACAGRLLQLMPLREKLALLHTSWT